LMPFGDTTVLSMSGASPGGVAVLIVAPEHDLVFAAFGNDMRTLALHDQLLLWLVEERLNAEVPALVADPEAAGDLNRFAGTYRSNQLRVDVCVVDGQLEERTTYEPVNAEQERVFSGFAGGLSAAPPRRYAPIGKNLFAPAGIP